jgi:bifunctional DNA-binding transcriptional regulator/antitoxin component of YhaV-PrlF toxin-antitoxin module
MHARLQRGNSVQVPRLVRWRHKLDPNEILDVHVYDRETYKSEHFYVEFGRDGRFTIPKLVVEALGAEAGDILEVTLYARHTEEVE